MAHRILVFGVTGIEKAATLRRFDKWCYQTNKLRPCHVIDFEKEFLVPLLKEKDLSYFEFLDNRLPEQHDKWQLAWDAFRKWLKSYERQHRDEDIFITLHGCFTRSYYGARSAIRPEQVASLKPTHIVTLIDNVYDVWWRTEARAKGAGFLGMPTLEHLLFARRVETLVADQVAHSSTSRVPHLIIAVNHPFQTLWNWLHSNDPKIVYLCFPISAPRDLLIKEHDQSGEHAINKFIQDSYRWQRENTNLVIICPLMIDELPLRVALMNGLTRKETSLQFDRESARWSLDKVLPPDSVLSPGPPPISDRAPIRLGAFNKGGIFEEEDSIHAATGMIHTDVGWRDFRLVDQAKYVAAFNPKFKNRETISRSVLEEIRHAAAFRKTPVYIYQDPAHDPDYTVLNTTFFAGEGGTMHSGPGEQRMKRMESVDEIFNTIAQSS